MANKNFKGICVCVRPFAQLFYKILIVIQTPLNAAGPTCIYNAYKIAESKKDNQNNYINEN